jgi:ArsR family transcriptional regulator
VDTKLIEEVNLLHARICQAVADPTRILMLYLLAEEPHYVNELAEALDVSQPTASHHLKVLRERGLVTAHREGTSIRYSLRDERVIEALDILRSVMAEVIAERAELASAL